MYVAEIMERFMSEAEMKQFHDRYVAARWRTSRSLRKPSKQDMNFFDDYRKGKFTIGEIAQKYGVSYGKVRDGIGRVAYAVATA